MKAQLTIEIQSAVLEYEGCNLSIPYVNTSTLNSLCTQAIQPRTELAIYQGTTVSTYYKPVEVPYTEGVLVPIMMDGITIMIPAVANKARIVQVEISANEAVTYFTQQRDHYYGLLGDAIADAQADMELLDTGINEDLMIAEASLELIEQSMGIVDAESLNSLLTSQASLATTQGKLTVWHAANRTAEGHLQTELFGNGLFTHRDINNETGLVSNIRTGVVLGSNIRDLAYEYDARGRITSKIDSSAHTDGRFDINTQEAFSYNDSQGRLSDWSFSQTIQEEVYDPVTVSSSTVTRDNQLSPSDHYYEHDDIGNLTYKASAGDMVYSSESNRLESRTHNGVTSHYAYDNNGNLQTGDGRSYQWTSFNKAASVSMAGAQTVDFTYDASHNRKVKKTANETRYYVNPGYELIERLATDGTTETIHRYTFFNENDQVAVFEKTEATAAASDQAKYADSISYVHRDILGSGELITDSRMNILARNFFSPYGEKVDDLLKAQAQAAGEQAYQAAKLGTGLIQSDSDDLGADLWTEFEQEGEADAFMSRYTAGASALDLSGVRGFTSHEEIQEMGLINMNARLYDPIIGRFMSADSIVPDLYTPLDHNRYSYVRGNPVSSRDPTGHNPLLVAAAVFFAWSHYGDNPTLQMASTVLLQVAMMNPATTPFAAGANATANAAMHSGLTSLTISFLKSGKVDRKSLENAGIASASAGLTHSIAHGWIGDKLGITGKGVQYKWAKVTAVHMVAQGAISDLRGDKFIHGAIAGLAAKSGGYMAKDMDTFTGTVIVSTFSGVASEATGGDFAEGAMAGAVVHLYNDLYDFMELDDPDVGDYFHHAVDEEIDIDGIDWEEPGEALGLWDTSKRLLGIASLVNPLSVGLGIAGVVVNVVDVLSGDTSAGSAIVGVAVEKAVSQRLHIKFNYASDDNIQRVSDITGNAVSEYYPE
jgi:RHS repeat-associated protein